MVELPTNASTYVIASEVGLEPLPMEARATIWRRVGAGPALTAVAELFRDLDSALGLHDRLAVDRASLNDVAPDLRASLLAELDRGRVVFSNTGLVQCLKEIVEFADESSSATLSTDELTRCVLSCQEDQNVIDSGIANRAANPDAATPEQFMADFTDIAVDWVAQQLFDHADPFETLACSVEETWRNGWAPGTKQSAIRDLGSSPSDVFEQVNGVPLDDFLSLAWVFMNLARQDGRVRYGLETLRELGISEELSEFFFDSCSRSVSDLRELLRVEGSTTGLSPWARYVLQEFPFVILNDGTFIMLRLQYVIQRMFGDLLYLKTHDKIKEVDGGRADRFKSAMNGIFEYRVGQTLKRIAQCESVFGGADIISEGQLKAAWKNRRGEHPKICDFVYVQGDRAILIDANNRQLPKKFADRSAEGADLRVEIRNMFAATKFEQLMSTVREFMRRGWNRSGTAIDGRTRYLPFVVAPNAGMQSNSFTEMLIMIEALPMLEGYNSMALAPSIITWRDLQILEAIAEQTQGHRVVDLMAQWRLYNHLLLKERRGLPVSFQEHLASRTPNGMPNLSAHDRTVGAQLFETLRWHAAETLMRSNESA